VKKMAYLNLLPSHYPVVPTDPKHARKSEQQLITKTRY